VHQAVAFAFGLTYHRAKDYLKGHAMTTRRRFLAGVGTAAILPTFRAMANEKPVSGDARFIGKWDVTVQGPKGSYPSWFEVRRSGRRSLVGSYVGQFGSARPIAHVVTTGDSMRFIVPPQWEDRKTDVVYEGKIDGEQIKGMTTGDEGEKLTWVARRAPLLKRAEPPRWGKAIELFNGKDLGGWKPQHEKIDNGWIARDGMLVNAKPGNNLMTDRKYDDFQLHAEFRYPKGSNSGIYLRGRYEVQIEDDYGMEPDSHLIGGVYGFLTPSTNPCKKAGEWQEMDITLVGRTLTIMFNGERIIDRQSIPGITGGALDSDEGASGPILLQGDHGPIEFRILRLTPAS
jgi:hypothetical protein